jgi:hypothetical protein
VVRTTLDIDDDVLLAVKERARRERRSAGRVISDLAREALTGRGAAAADAGGGRHGFHPLPHRGPVVSNEVIDRLLDDEPE